MENVKLKLKTAIKVAITVRCPCASCGVHLDPGSDGYWVQRGDGKTSVILHPMCFEMLAAGVPGIIKPI